MGDKYNKSPFIKGLKDFLTSLPGVLTGIAAVITAIVALLAIFQTGPPVINDFTANPSIIDAGESSKLVWSISNAESVFIDHGIGSVEESGFESVSPDVTTTYTLTANNDAGSVNKMATIEVIAPEKPVIGSFDADPSNIDAGESSVLSWSISNAESVSIDHGIGSVEASGSRSISPAETTAYTITAVNEADTAQKTIQVVVKKKPVISSFDANPSSIDVGESSILSWKISNSKNVFME